MSPHGVAATTVYPTMTLSTHSHSHRTNVYLGVIGSMIQVVLVQCPLAHACDHPRYTLIIKLQGNGHDKGISGLTAAFSVVLPASKWLLITHRWAQKRSQP